MKGGGRREAVGAETSEEQHDHRDGDNVMFLRDGQELLAQALRRERAERMH